MNEFTYSYPVQALSAGSSQDETNSTDAEETATKQETDDDAVSGAIVVYYSASGNTKRVAEIAAAETGAELFELTPKNPLDRDGHG